MRLGGGGSSTERGGTLSGREIDKAEHQPEYRMGHFGRSRREMEKEREAEKRIESHGRNFPHSLPFPILFRFDRI